MKNKNGKRLIAVICAVALMATLAGCGAGGSSKSTKAKKGGSSEVDLKNTTYEMTDLSVPELKGDVSILKTVGDTVYVSTEESEDLTDYPADWVDGFPPDDADENAWDSVDFKYSYKSHVYSINQDGTGAKKLFDIEYPAGSNWSTMTMTVDEKQNFYVISSAYNDALEMNEYKLTIYDNTGKANKDFSLTDFFEKDEGVYVQAISVTKDGLIYLNCDPYVLVVDESGKEIFRIKNDNYVGNLVQDKDGTVVVSTYENDGEVLKKVDAGKKGYGDSVKLSSSVSTLIEGMGEFDFYDQTSNGIDGLAFDGTRTALLNWVGSNVNGQNVIRVTPLSDGNFMAYYYDYNLSPEENTDCLKLLKKVSPDQVKDKVAITFGGIWISDEQKAKAIAFNKSQNQYQVMIRDYGNEDDPVSKLNADILAGDIPDIIDLSSIDADKFIAKGLVTDLYPFMEKDDTIKKEDFIESALKAMEKDGKLYYVTPRFSLNVLVGSKDDLGDKDHLTIREMMEVEKKYPDAKAFSDTTSNVSILSTFTQSNYTHFVDWNTGKCSYDSDEFISLLEYANTYPAEDDIDYENYSDMVDLVRSHKQLFVELWNMSYLDLEMYDKLYENKAVYFGYPSDTPGIGFTPSTMLGISSKSKYQDAAWAFVKTMLTKEAVGDSSEDVVWYDGFPLRKDCLEAELKRVSATEKFTDEFGKEREPVDAEWGLSEELTVKIGPMSQEQCDLIRRIIDRVDHRQTYDNEIDQIISEETGAFFSGQKSAKDVAGIIQNRVSTYVNENR